MGRKSICEQFLLRFAKSFLFFAHRLCVNWANQDARLMPSMNSNNMLDNDCQRFFCTQKMIQYYCDIFIELEK